MTIRILIQMIDDEVVARCDHEDVKLLICSAPEGGGMAALNVEVEHTSLDDMGDIALGYIDEYAYKPGDDNVYLDEAADSIKEIDTWMN